LLLQMRTLAVGMVVAAGLCRGFLAHADVYAFGLLAGWPGATGAVDKPNTDARFYNPYAVTVDRAGNLYVADTINCTIRKVWASGTNWMTSTIAGLANTSGWADGANNAARFSAPLGLTLDSAGNLYVADTGNHVIRKVAPVGTNWVVSTLAGSYQRSGSKDGTNSAALFNSPCGVTVDHAGALYVTDNSDSIIRKVAPSGTNWVVTTLAGSTDGMPGNTDGTNRNASFNAPYALAVDSATNLYVADAGNNAIRKVRPVGTNWVVTTLAGGAYTPGSRDGTNTAAQFVSPYGVTVDSATNLYVADTGNSTIRKLVPAGTNWVSRTIGGLAGNSGGMNGTNSGARFSSPAGLAVDGAGMLYIADTDNDTIRLGAPWLTNAPPLSFARTTNSLILSWPLTGYGFWPKTRSSASTGSWTWVSGVPTVAGTRYYWTNTLGKSPAYYRLFNQ
jgi:NHL repeat